jgi:prepilin-type N-terminal cleavage/methylation domain-containing protein
MEQPLHKRQRMKASNIAKSKARGFSLVELLVVIGLIATLGAISLPNLIGFFRSSRIRAGLDLVASAIQGARNKAIVRNTQKGITFVVQDATTFWVHIEDTIPGVSTGDVGYTRQGVNFTSPNTNLSTKYTLPRFVEFAANATDCPQITSFAPAASALRFDRYGLSTFLPPLSTDLAPAEALVVSGGSISSTRIFAPTASGDRSVCLIDRQTDLRRWVQVSPGGRVIRN